MVTANVRGSSAEEVATTLANNGAQLLRGLQGPTISPIYTPSSDGSPSKEAGYGVPYTRTPQGLLAAVAFTRQN